MQENDHHLNHAILEDAPPISAVTSMQALESGLKRGLTCEEDSGVLSWYPPKKHRDTLDTIERKTAVDMGPRSTSLGASVPGEAGALSKAAEFVWNAERPGRCVQPQPRQGRQRRRFPRRGAGQHKVSSGEIPYPDSSSVVHAIGFQPNDTTLHLKHVVSSSPVHSIGFQPNDTTLHLKHVVSSSPTSAQLEKPSTATREDRLRGSFARNLTTGTSAYHCLSRSCGPSSCGI